MVTVRFQAVGKDEVFEGQLSLNRGPTPTGWSAELGVATLPLLWVTTYTMNPLHLELWSESGGERWRCDARIFAYRTKEFFDRPHEARDVRISLTPPRAEPISLEDLQTKLGLLESNSLPTF